MCTVGGYLCSWRRTFKCTAWRLNRLRPGRTLKCEKKTALAVRPGYSMQQNTLRSVVQQDVCYETFAALHKPFLKFCLGEELVQQLCVERKIKWYHAEIEMYVYVVWC